MKGPAPPARFEWVGRVLLAAAALAAAAFFASRWGINADGWGARDAGLALSLSFANALTLYACAGLAVLAVALALMAAAARRPWRLFAGAALLSALPLTYLAARDAF